MKWELVDFDNDFYSLIKSAFVYKSDKKYFNEAVKNKLCQCYLVKSKKVNIACILRSEKDELVICCVAGKGYIDFLKELKKRAIDQGFKSIRGHFKKKGLERMLRRSFNIKLVEYVYKLEI